jgi:ankyrin repeat protein
MNRWRIAACLLIVFSFGGCAVLPSGTGPIAPEPLHEAIVADDAEFLSLAVRAGRANVNQRIPAPVYSEGTPLITIAARAGSVRVTEFLIASRADINARTPADETALMLASYFRGLKETDLTAAYSEKHERIVRMLVEAGADLENTHYSYTPLAYAAYQGHDRIIRYLLEKGARVNADAGPDICYINTPLMMAAMQGHQSSTLMLLRAGANARVRVHQGLTAAELAAKYQGKNLVPVLRCAERLGPGQRFSQVCEGQAR